MSASKGNISIHAKNIMPIIKRWLYSDKDIFIREMVSNGCDAIVKQKMAHPDKDSDYRVTVTLDVPKKELRFSDNGIGMTEDEVKRYINQVAFSSAEEFLKNYEGENKGGIIGHFGLGFYSAFMVAKKVTIHTLSEAEGAAPVLWESEDGMKFQISDGSRDTRGTVITLELADDEEEFLQEYKVQDVLKRYCGFMAQPVILEVDQARRARIRTAKTRRTSPRKSRKLPSASTIRPRFGSSSPRTARTRNTRISTKRFSTCTTSRCFTCT